MAAKRGRGVLRKDGQPRESNVGTAKPVVDDSNWRVKVVAMHRIKFDDVAKQRYLAELASTGRRWAAEKAAGVARSTVDDHKKKDPDFSAACEEAAEAYATSGIMKIERDILNGQLEVRYDGEGNVVSEIVRHETPLRAMFLKANDERYRDKATLELTGKVGVVFAPPLASMDDWKRMAEQHDQASAKAQNPDAADGTSVH